MAFSINTNIASLQAQEYLRVTGDFQNKTINRVTSGMRIVAAGDDAAGLAIANGFRSDQAVLSQGIRNANDGLAILQTIDGGVTNVAKLLDRARTLAAQSSSDTFDGDRTVLNNEFQSVIQEIDRQAQTIGLDLGGRFNKSLSVFIGGGRDHNGITQNNNGSVTVDLSTAAVDSKSLGLTGLQASSGADFSAAGSTVSEILADGANNQSTADFTFYGAGFGRTGTSKVTVQVQKNGITNGQTLADAINAAMAGYSPATPEGTALKNANIRASMSSDGKNLIFTSSKTAFAVEGSNALAAAFLGGFGGGAGPDGDVSVAGARRESSGDHNLGVTYSAALVKADTETQNLILSVADAAGTLQTFKVTVDSASAAGANLTIAEAVDQINVQLQNSGIAAMKDVVAYKDGASGGTTIKFMTKGNPFTVSIGAGTNAHGFTDGTDQSVNVASAANGSAITSDIGSAAAAKDAVTQIAEAVKTLGVAQADVGKSQNLLTYAVSLASTQLTNLAASESRIRDADLATEAANLTKAQILQQAGVAALAQANSAPQAVLSLLRG